MQLEFHQLDRRCEPLRVRNPQRQRRLLASLAATGQQTPIIVIAVLDQSNRYLVIDGYQRIAALATTRPGHGRGRGLAYERSRSSGVGSLAALVEHETALWKKAGCWPNWSSVSAMVSTSWRAALIAA